MVKCTSLAAILSIVAIPAIAQSLTPANIEPTTTGQQFATMPSAGVAPGHLAVGGAQTGQLADGGVPAASGNPTPSPVQLAAGSNTLTATQMSSGGGAIFWLNSSSPSTVTLPSPTVGFPRGFFETDGIGTLTITSPTSFVNFASGATLVLSQPYQFSVWIWSDGTTYHVGSVF